jgi:hypothetical protein
MNPARMQHAGIVAGSQVPVDLSPEGPQCGDLAEDIAAALEANPAAGAFFDTEFRVPICELVQDAALVAWVTVAAPPDQSHGTRVRRVALLSTRSLL